VRNSITLITTSLLTVTILSLPLIAPANATNWVGNDDGEFDWTSCFNCPVPHYVGLQESFNSAMQWSSSPPNNLVSMQYNPDYWTSFWNGWDGDWFQTIIWSDGNGCGAFSIQVYSLSDARLDWRADQGFSVCSSAFLASGAIWNIREDEVYNPNGHISDVAFYIGGGSTSLSYTLYPSIQYYNFLRSNLCWCGTDLGTTTFTSAWGQSNAYSDVNLYAVNPPSQVSTAENSNMPYSTFSNSPSTTMFQNFGWVPPPPPCTSCCFRPAGAVPAAVAPTTSNSRPLCN